MKRAEAVSSETLHMEGKEKNQDYRSNTVVLVFVQGAKI